MSFVVQAEKIRMSYGEKEALRGVDLHILKGEVVVLLGPNGAGKTTLMEILEGVRQRTSGQASVLGQDPGAADDAWRGRVGIVLQSWLDHREWRVGALLRHMSLYHERPADLDELAERTGLTDFLGQRVRTLSGGQRRRMDLALALVGQPELLFLDEPTAALDPQARRSFQDLITWVSERGVTTLVTTHDLAEADRLAHRIVIIANGRVTYSGTRMDLARENDGEATVRWTGEDRVHEERTADPSSLLARLQADFGTVVPGLEVRRRTLEDWYLDHLREVDTADSPSPETTEAKEGSACR